jgi:hypothetical protein
MSGGEAVAIGFGERDLGWREAVRNCAIAFVVLAAFPKLGHWSLRPARLGPRALAAYIAFNALAGFALRTWALPYLQRVAAEQERARAELAQVLGRRPTDAEVLEHLGLTCKR